MVAVGMKVERLLQVLKRQENVSERIASMKSEREDVQSERQTDSGELLDDEEVEEETDQLDSEIGALKRELQTLKDEERALREAMSKMKGYASELSGSNDTAELADWASHFLGSEPMVAACRERLTLLEDWQLRVGRSSDFNAALLSWARVIAGTCVGIAGVKGMEEVAYDLCIVDEASKATATEILIPMVRSRRSDSCRRTRNSYLLSSRSSEMIYCQSLMTSRSSRLCSINSSTNEMDFPRRAARSYATSTG